MSIVQRVQAILLKPATTWPEIERESSSVKRIYVEYLLVLAAIPAVAGFIGYSLIGTGAFGVSFRVPVLSGLANMVVGYIMSLVMLYVLGLIANGLAPSFGGVKNPLSAFKLVAYGATAGFVGGIFNALPSLSILGLVAALYSIYLLYVGAPLLMKIPAGKALGYTAVLLVCGIVAALVVGAIGNLFTGGPRMGAMSGDAGSAAPGEMAIKVPGGKVTLDVAKLEAAAKKMEQAQASGDTAAAGKAATEAIGAALGGGGAAIPAQEFKAFLPESLGGLKRESIDARTQELAGFSYSAVEGEYVSEEKRLSLNIIDAGAAPALTMALVAWSGATGEHEDQASVEKVFKQGGRMVREEYSKDGSSAESSVILENGLVVQLSANGIASPMEAVRKALASLDLNRIAAVKRPGK